MMFIFFVGVAIVLGFLGILIVVNTPLKAMLPGYLYSYQREDYYNTSNQLDSISSEVKMRNDYLANIVNVLQGNVDSVIPDISSAAIQEKIPIDSIITASETEREFVRQYEQSEKFNLSVLTPIAAHGFAFVNPMLGATARFPEEGEDSRRVTFDMPRLQAVSSVYRGNVLDIYNTLDNGFTIIVQHPNDFVSRYSGLSEVFVHRGDRVQPGMRIGLIERDKAENFATQPSFELWYNGTAVNPRNYIPF